MTVSWPALEQLHERAKKRGVSWQLQYDESCDEWQVSIHSAAPAERNEFGEMTFDGAIKAACDWLDKL